MTKEETIAATMERAYRAGVIGRAEMFKIKIRDTQREERGEMRSPPAGKGSAEGKRGRRYSSLPG